MNETKDASPAPVERLVSPLTLDKLKNAVELMRKNAIPPCVVKTAKDARELTRNDPCGHKWKIGEEYYRAETLHRTMPVRANG